MKKLFISFAITMVVSLFNIAICYATDYYISNSGSDSNSGTTQSQPWKTISKVNSFNFAPGDVINFEKGGIWREQLIPVSGNSSGYIKYTSYGNGEKPLLLGSVEANNSSLWRSESPNVWSFVGDVSSSELIKSGWSMYAGDDASITNNKSIASNGYQVTVSRSGNSSSSIQLSAACLNLEKGKTYKLSFKAKASTAFKIAYIGLIKNSSPWTDYTEKHSNWSPVISENYENYNIYYTANASSSDARITIYLGKNIPADSTFYINSASFNIVNESYVACDVGNIIFNNGETFGVKKWSEADLHAQNDYWYDDNTNTLKLYSSYNPNSLYKDIELALTKNIIEEANKSFVEYEGLKLSYGGAHGIGGESTHHIIVKNCDICYMGGGNQYVSGKNVRFGNGVEFFNNAHDNHVSDCNIWQIYDSGLTNQGYLDGNAQYNIHYEHNTIKDCEYSFEYWNRGSTSTTKNIYFEYNTCLNAGMGWGHAQRPDKLGRHIVLWDNSAITGDIYVRNNNIGVAELACIALTDDGFKGIENLHLDNNSYSQYNGKVVIDWGGKEFFKNNFVSYQNTYKNDISSNVNSVKYTN